jgi:hypothetical protein
MATKTASKKTVAFRKAFEDDSDLKKYGSNALLLFALSLYFRIDSIDQFAAEALTDGPDDKKVDLCFIELSEKRAVIAQTYVSTTWGKKAAPSNKASDLNTGIAWLLTTNERKVPKALRSKAM